MNLLNRCKIRTKILGNILVIIFLFIIAFAVYQKALTHTERGFSEIHEQEDRITDATLRVNILMLLARSAEAEFLLHKDLQYQPEVEKAMEELSSEINTVGSVAGQAELLEIENISRIIKDDAKAYLKAFHLVVESYVLQGLDHQSGFQGTFRAAAHAFSGKMRQHGVDNLVEDLLQMRRFEKDYLKTKSDKDRAIFRASITKYEKELAGSGCDPVAKKSQEAAISRYKEAADNFFSAAVDKGGDNYYQLMRRAAQEMETALDSIRISQAAEFALEIRKNEKDYLLRRNEEYIKATFASVENLERAMVGASILPEHVADIKIDLDKYKAAFSALVEQDKQIAKLVAEMTRADQDIRRKVEDIARLAKNAESEQFETIRAAAANSSRLALLIGSLSLITGILLSLFVTNAITRPLQNSIPEVERIAEGDFSVSLSSASEDEVGVMINALGNMSAKIAEMNRLNLRQIWLVESQAGLVEKIRGELNLKVLAETICAYLSETISAQIATLYLLTDDQELKLTGDYAFHLRKGLADKIQIGQGLVGEAARSGKLISITDIPEGYIRINSSLGDSQPANIVVLPFLHEDKVLGVIELASCHEFSPDQLKLLGNCRETIAIAVNSARIHHRINELLEEGQLQNEELQTQQEELQAANEELRESQETLQAQQEELRVSNEELQEKSSSLERSEKNLQAQQEELRVTNEELEEKNKFMALKQDEIRQKNVELEDIRTHLELKAKELEISSRYKSEFLANMSHELRTPLNSLLILSQDLLADKKKNLSEEQLESLDIIYKGGNDLLELINEILDLAKIESGRLDINLATVPFKELAANLTDCFSLLAADKKLDFSVHLNPKLPPAMTTDYQKVMQILRNLCGNAIKFTRKGSVKVDIVMADSDSGLAKNLTDRQVVLIRVSDTGIGVAKDKHTEIFEAFQQADGSTSREFGGTGLGLSISRELAKLLGGEITLTSKVGKGSVFNLYLPLELHSEKQPATNTPRPGEKQQQGKNTEEAVAKRKKAAHEVSNIDDDRQDIGEKDRVILVIEDDPDFAAILKRLCHQRGYKFLHAGGGVTGLVLAEQYKPDGIILDLILPEMSGWDVLNTLKNNKKTRHIPVHIISGDPSAHSGTSRGAVGVLLKPSSAEDIDTAFGRIEAVFARKVKKLLIVEDDDVLRKSLLKMTTSDTVAVTAVAGGNEALAELQGAEYDCMILDLSLPDKNGFEVLKEISALDENKKPPVIVYTGKELSQEEEYTLKRYANSIILKTARSSERLMDEAELFLHKMSDDLPEEKRKREAKIRNYEEELQGKEILLVDDDMRNMFALSKIMKDNGMKVHQAPDGQKALEIMGREKNIRLVVMDIMMPIMDGYEAIRQVRKMKNYAKVPIIALTAKAMPADRSKCIEAGASDYLAKPVEIEKLLSLIRVWI